MGISQEEKDKRAAEHGRKRKRKVKDLTGQRFNQLTVVSRADDYINPSGNRFVQWNCKCDCGNMCVKRGTALTSGKAKSCGCARSSSNKGKGLIDLKGKRFGYWTVLGRSEDHVDSRGKHWPMWLCECRCGTRKAINGASLRAGSSLSCGCYKLEQLSIDRDLVGERFGHLTVLSCSEDKYMYGRRNKMWHCVCECGNECDVREPDLLSGSTQSCGCLAKSLNETFFEELLEENNIDYEPQKTYPDLIGEKGYNLRYDFCLHVGEDVLVELNGVQHYHPVDMFGGKDGFEHQSKTYDAKCKYARDHGIRLYEVDCSDRPTKFLLKLELNRIFEDLRVQGVCDVDVEVRSTKRDSLEVPRPDKASYAQRNLSHWARYYQQDVFYGEEKRLWEQNGDYRGVPLRTYLYENRKQYIGKDADELTDFELLRAFRISGVLRGYTVFDVKLMAQAVSKFGINSIYDPCAGWGERMLWCRGNGVRYLGVDVNGALEPGYRRMADDFGMTEQRFVVADSSEYEPDGVFDAVLTCPPYGNTEIYSDKGAENLPEYAFSKWWSAVVAHSTIGLPRCFCVQVNTKYREMMASAVEGAGYKLVDELFFGANKSSHFVRAKGAASRASKESMLVFERE